MAFGGTVKLTGESEYRQALQRCTQSLQSMSNALKSQTASFDSNDKSIKNTAAMQKELNDTIKKQEAELSKAKNAYAQYGVALQAQTTRHNALNKEFRNAVTELDRIKKASGESSTEYKKQAEVVDKLGQELADSASKLDENKRAMSNLKSEINSSTKTIDNARKSIDELGKEAKDTGKEAENAGDGFTVFKGVLSNLATQGINAAISGLRKLGTAVFNVGKQAINSYAQYEQLVGGVETLFKDSAKIVEDYANNAYKTAGLSANEYMETVTSFSASLLQSLGKDTKKAAEYGDMAITDMSDNANKMGTSMEMIQNAYQGFAKQNYTMLDNLKLGYGGTKTEMERLIKDANKVKKANGDMAELSISSFADVVEAIHIMQTEMGITGTTAKEADSTIEGSAKSMRASWQNLLTGISDDTQDLDKLIDNFVDSVITYSDNMVPRIKKTVDGIKRLINSIVTEVFPKLKREIPELRPLIETFEWFIKNKDLVVNSLKLMVAAFAVNKILTFTKTLSDAAKGLIGIVTQSLTAAAATTANTAATTANTAAQTKNTIAQIAGATATKGLATAQGLLNAAWKANPIGLIVTGVTAAVGLFGVFKKKTDELTEAEKAQQKAIEDQAQAIADNKASWEDLQKTRQASIDAGMTEMSYYETLYDELQGIVDQNGKVKDGYQERASFITSTLSEALGIEINNVNGVIQKYGDLKNTIDEVMEKKKAQIILDSQESMYAEAIQKQSDAVRTLNDIEQQLDDKRAERSQLEQTRKEIEAQYATATSGTVRYGLLMQMLDIEKKMKKNDEDTANIQKNYDEQEGLLQNYAYNIGQYEQNMALFHEGKYDEMTNVNWNYVKEYEKAGDAEKAQLEDQIKVTEKNLEILKGLKDKSGKDIYDSQIKAAEKQLEQQKKDLKQYESATKTGLDASKVQWSNGLDNILSTITGKNITFKEDGKGNVQMYVDGVKSGKKTSKDEMAKIVSETITEVTKKDKDAKKAGEDLIDGVNNGVKNQDKQSSVFSSISKFGSSLLSKLKSSLKEKSPSKATKEMGQFLLEGLGIGIEQEENSVLKQVSNVGKNVLTALQDELNQNVRIGNLQASVDSSSSSAANQYYNTVEAFKEALSEMKIEMDDTEMGKFVDKTVSRTIYS